MDNDYLDHVVEDRMRDALRSAEILRETISRNTPPIPAVDNALDGLDCELSLLKIAVNKRSKNSGTKLER